MRAILVLVLALLIGCASGAVEEAAPTTVRNTAATAPRPVSAPPDSAPTTSTPASTSMASTTTTTTLPADPIEAGMVLAQQLATAYADSDWETARRISPLPEWDDATYEEGFAGLEASTIWLGGTDESAPDRVVLYLLQVAHELRDGTEQTSAYCVRWDFLTATSTIEKVAGELLAQESGFTPPTDLQRGAAACNAFDVDDAPAPPAVVDPPPSPQPPNAPSVDDDLPIGWRLLDRLGTTYVCRPASDFDAGYGDLDCQQFTGTIPAFSLTELRCSPDGVSFACTTEDYYPSELEEFEVQTIDFKRVLCRSTECWIWSEWESPTEATTGWPDYRCAGLSCRPS